MRKNSQLQLKMLLAYLKLEMSLSKKPKMKTFGKQQKLKAELVRPLASMQVGSIQRTLLPRKQVVFILGMVLISGKYEKMNI